MTGKTYLKFPITLRVKVRDLFKKGYSKREISKRTNISCYYINDILANISPTNEVKEKAIQMYKEGDKLVYIALKLGISKSSVHNYVKHGIDK